MAGRHALAARRPKRGRSGRLGLAVVLLAATVLAGMAVAVWPRESRPAPTASADPEPDSQVLAQERDRAAGRPSRGGGARAERPEASPPPAEPANPEPEEAAADPVPDGGEVVATGSCQASYYWEPQPTASGEPFDPEAMTAAHLTWAFDTRVRVTNPATGQSVVVRINDRGPYVDGRCIDLSRGAFREIAQLDAGVVTVTYEVLSD